MAVPLADGQALAAGAALVLACGVAVALALLVRDRAGAPPAEERPPPEPPPPAATPPPPGPEAVPGLVELARRGRELADQQRELLGQVGDHADPTLPGRLRQLDRLAVRARRNAHHLIVLAGGEPEHRWDRPVPLPELVAAAVRDNPDGSRVDQLVADQLLVPAAVADDLVALLADLVDNAIAFSAPETRVRISGQLVGSGYVLEVEDRGLGMTDAELRAVNQALAGHLAGGGRAQRLGAWVAGRLADRHGLRVQVRRSAHGGVTALVFLPKTRPATPLHGDRGTRDGRNAPAGQREPGTALAELPARRYLARPPEGVGERLPKRAPHTSLAPDLAAADAGRPGDPSSRPAARSPEQVRNMLSRYRSGLERGRAAAARDLPRDPEDDPPS